MIQSKLKIRNVILIVKLNNLNIIRTLKLTMIKELLILLRIKFLYKTSDAIGTVSKNWPAYSELCVNPNVSLMLLSVTFTVGNDAVEYK